MINCLMTSSFHSCYSRRIEWMQHQHHKDHFRSSLSDLHRRLWASSLVSSLSTRIRRLVAGDDVTKAISRWASFRQVDVSGFGIDSVKAPKLLRVLMTSAFGERNSVEKSSRPFNDVIAVDDVAVSSKSVWIVTGDGKLRSMTRSVIGKYHLVTNWL